MPTQRAVPDESSDFSHDTDIRSRHGGVIARGAETGKHILSVVTLLINNQFVYAHKKPHLYTLFSKYLKNMCSFIWMQTVRSKYF